MVIMVLGTVMVMIVRQGEEEEHSEVVKLSQATLADLPSKKLRRRPTEEANGFGWL